MFCLPSHWRLTYSRVVVSLQEHESFLIGQASIHMYLMHRPGFDPLPWKKRRTEVTAVLDVQLSLCRKSLKCTLNRPAQHACMELLAEKEEIRRRNGRRDSAHCTDVGP